MPFLIDPNEELDEDQLQTKDDLSVWGLLDVLMDRRPMVPVTVYITQGDSTSSIAGLLRPNGEFSPKRSTRLGQIFVAGTLHDVRPAPFEARVTYEVMWDGATPSPEFVTLEGETRREHSHGMLLGDYTRRAPIVMRGGANRRNTSELVLDSGDYVTRRKRLGKGSRRVEQIDSQW